MSRDYDPVPGQWYQDLDSAENFQVVSLDPDLEIVRIHWLEGEIEEMDLDGWSEMDVELADAPEGWGEDDDDEEEEEEEEDDWDDDDDDEDDEEDDDDWDDDDDEHRARE